MACIPCKEKLALRLVRNHPARVDWILALTLAQKAMERVEARDPEPQAPQDPYDYTQPCTNLCGTAPCPDAGILCGVDADCTPITTGCTGSAPCPVPSKPNSHLESSTCVCEPTGYKCQRCSAHKCVSTSSCSPTGLCYYHCDPGYVWDPSTQQCVSPFAGSTAHVLMAEAIIED